MAAVVGDLGKKSVAELAEMLERQEKLLSNKALLAKLPDKGDKIWRVREEIERAYVNKQKFEVKNATEMLSTMNLIDEMENMDSDEGGEGSEKVLKILATHDSTNKEVFYEKVAVKFDEKLSDNDNNKRFNKPRKCTLKRAPILPKSSMDDEESAVRYPIGPHESSKVLTLQESVILQRNYDEKLRLIKTQEASLSLSETVEDIKMIDYKPGPVEKMLYRDIMDEIDSEDDMVERRDSAESDEDDLL